MNMKRLQYKHNGQLIYEWEQTLEDIHVYFFPPKWALPKYLSENQKEHGSNFKTAKIKVDIQPKKLKICIEPNPPFLDVR